MAKAKKVQFVCTECGSDYSKWQGQCSSCKAWDSLKEFRESAGTASRSANFSGFSGQIAEVQTLDQVNLADHPRFSSGSSEFDRVLGGGIVPGSAVLIGGEPGAGKSTLLLQTLCRLAQTHSALYVTGEESLQQVAMRANRLGLPVDKLKIASETDVQKICELAKVHKPAMLVVDSIQVVHSPEIESAPGSVSQVREAAAYLTRFAKQTGTVLFLVGHVTKDGGLAGPKVLEHMIDCSIMLEGSADSRFRTLRGIKNRFGAVNELGVFAMLDSGLKEVKNPSSIFLNKQSDETPGSVVTTIWEGTRPMLIELQALVDDTHAPMPKRVVVGWDHQRLSMLLAILNRHCGVFTGDQDVYLNVVGGVKINETSADLASLVAVLSSLRNKPVSSQLIVLGELGLSGEVRPVVSGEQRIREAAKHGFTRAIVPKANAPKKAISGIKVIAVEKLQQAIDSVWDD